MLYRARFNFQISPEKVDSTHGASETKLRLSSRQRRRWRSYRSMISGPASVIRWHVDKLEAIPGFNVNLSLTNFDHVFKNAAWLIGQTKEIAPADKKFYALRDATSTSEHWPDLRLYHE